MEFYNFELCKYATYDPDSCEYCFKKHEWIKPEACNNCPLYEKDRQFSWLNLEAKEK